MIDWSVDLIIDLDHRRHGVPNPELGHRRIVGSPVGHCERRRRRTHSSECSFDVAVVLPSAGWGLASTTTCRARRCVPLSLAADDATTWEK